MDSVVLTVVAITGVVLFIAVLIIASSLSNIPPINKGQSKQPVKNKLL